MIKSITMQAPAKLNLYLDIEEKLENGYHNMKMIMQTVTLFDDVKIEKNKSGKIEIYSSNNKMPLDEKNIAYKAAEAFYKLGKAEFTGLKITIDKKIPMEAGMGGGSADAAAVLNGLNITEESNISEEEMLKTACLLGGDVPFALKGGTCSAEGIGEKLNSLKPISNMAFVIIKPDAGVSTKEAFHRFDEEKIKNQDRYTDIIKALELNQRENIISDMQNIFENLCPLKEVREYRDILLDAGAEKAMMTGSGSAVFGVFKNIDDAEKAAEKIRKEIKNVWTAVPFSKGACPKN